MDRGGGGGEGGGWGIVIERIRGVEFEESYFLGGWGVIVSLTILLLDKKRDQFVLYCYYIIPRRTMCTDFTSNTFESVQD